MQCNTVTASQHCLACTPHTQASKLQNCSRHVLMSLSLDPHAIHNAQHVRHHVAGSHDGAAGPAGGREPRKPCAGTQGVLLQLVLVQASCLQQQE